VLLLAGAVVAAATVIALLRPDRPEPGLRGEVPHAAAADGRAAPGGAGPTVTRRIAGRVLGPDGAPAAAADVALFRLEGREIELPPELDATRTDAAGSFAFAIGSERDLAVGARMPGAISGLVAVGDGRREIVLRLGNSYEVRGYVSDHFAPVAGCEVVLEPEDDRFFAHVTRTGPDGAFRFTGIYPGLVALSARTPLYRPAVQRGIVVGGSEPLRLHFPREPALTLEGRVVLDGTQADPLAGATVRATPQRDDRVRLHAVPHVTETRADGTFELSGLSAGVHRLEIAHPQRSTAIRTVSVDGRAAPLAVKLSPRVAVRGRLIGAELVSTELLLVTQARERARTRTDTGGRFEFPGTYSAGPATLVLQERAICFEQTSDRRVVLELDGAAVSLAVAPALLLTGDVGDAGNQPIQGVEVFVESEWMPGIDLLREPAAVTDEDGRYQLHVGLQAAPELLFRHPAFAATMVRLPRHASGMQQTVTLHPPSRIAGVVRRDGKPLPAAIVHLPPDGPTRAWSTTGPDGAFALHGIPPGEHQILVRYGTLTEFSASATVLPGLDTEHLVLTVPPGRSLAGRVVDGQGQPLPDVLVSVDAPLALYVATDAGGRFTLDVPRGEVRVRAFAPEWRLEESQPVAAGGDDVQLVLPVPPHGRLRGRLVGVPGQRPNGALLVIARKEAAAAGAETAPMTQWFDVRDGELDCPRFPAGASRLSLRCTGYVPWTADVDLVPGGEVDLGTCRLEVGARVRGVVLDEAGRPVSGARVLLGSETDLFVVRDATRMRDDAAFGTRADLRGRFALTGVSSTLHTLVVDAAGFATRTVALAIPGDLLRPDAIELRLSPGADIVAVLRDAGGEAVPGRMVELRKAGFACGLARTDAAGRCHFRHASAGDYEVTLLGTPVAARVKVGDAPSYEAPLRLEEK
jgi:protocatechuate 3,4-dioxygenase beta subunit